MKEKDIYCDECGRFLLKLAYGIVTVKCPNSKCKHVNHVKLIDQNALQLLTLEQENNIIKA